jgi:hypothetical protein
LQERISDRQQDINKVSALEIIEEVEETEVTKLEFFSKTG